MAMDISSKLAVYIQRAGKNKFPGAFLVSCCRGTILPCLAFSNFVCEKA
jgi:hypothetical protein